MLFIILLIGFVLPIVNCQIPITNPIPIVESTAESESIQSSNFKIYLVKDLPIEQQFEIRKIINGYDEDKMAEILNNLDEEELEQVIDIIDHDSPLYGKLLQTDDSSAATPYIFLMLGLICLGLVFNKKLFDFY